MDTQKVLKVGRAQISKPTPQFLKDIFRYYSFIVGTWALVGPQVTEIPPHVTATLTRWLAVGFTLMHFGIKFFGWDYKTESNGE